MTITIKAEGEQGGILLYGGTTIVCGNVVAHGKERFGMYMETGTKFTLNGDLEVRGGDYGFWVGGEASINSKGDAGIKIVNEGEEVSLRCFGAEGGGRWVSKGKMSVIQNNIPKAIWISDCSFKHEGGLQINNQREIAIRGNICNQEDTNIISIVGGADIDLKINHPLVINGLMFDGSTKVAVNIDCPDLTLNKPLVLSGPTTISGKGTIELDDIQILPGASLNVKGDFNIHVGTRLIEQLAASPLGEMAVASADHLINSGRALIANPLSKVA